MPPLAANRGDLVPLARLPRHHIAEPLFWELDLAGGGVKKKSGNLQDFDSSPPPPAIIVTRSLTHTHAS